MAIKFFKLCFCCHNTEIYKFSYCLRKNGKLHNITYIFFKIKQRMNQNIHVLISKFFLEICHWKVNLFPISDSNYSLSSCFR